MSKKIMIPAKEIKAFTFDELSDEAKSKVIDWINDDQFFDDIITESMEYVLSKYFHHFEIIEYDLFLHKISFRGKFKDEKELIAEAICKSFEDSIARHLLCLICHDYLSFDIYILSSNRTYCEVDINYSWFDLREGTEKLENILVYFFQSKLDEISNEAIKAGIDEYNFRCSDECVSEDCEANGYVFDEKGNPIHHLGELVEE